MGDFREGGQGLKLLGWSEGSVKINTGYLGEIENETKWTKKSHFSSSFIVMSVPKRLKQLPSQIYIQRLQIPRVDCLGPFVSASARG